MEKKPLDFCAEQLLKVSVIKERVDYILANIFEVAESRKDSIGNEELTQAGIYKCSRKIFIEVPHVQVQGAVGQAGMQKKRAALGSQGSPQAGQGEMPNSTNRHCLQD